MADTQLAEAASRVKTYESKGVVKTITPSRQYINVDHEEITDFMDAMTMMFAVKDTSLLTDISADDSIAFKIEVATSMPEIVEIQRLSQD